MNIGKRFLAILTVLIITGIVVQVFRLIQFQRVLKVKQETVSTEFAPVSAQSKLEKPVYHIVLYSNKGQGSKYIMENIRRTFDLAKINYKSFDISSSRFYAELKKIPFGGVVIISTEQLVSLKKPQAIKSFVREGGHLIFMTRRYFPLFNDMTGILKSFGFDQETYGITFNKPIFLSLNKFNINTPLLSHSSLKIDLDPQTDLLATNDDGDPLIWTHSYGQGEILYVNSSCMQDKLNRGLMLQCISYISPVFLSTIQNSKIFNIDDFPAPIKRGIDPKIYKAYHLNNKMFYRNIWWSKMYHFAKKYRLKYTGLMIGQYNLVTQGALPDFYEVEVDDITYFGRQLAELEGEIGIHGYNHNPLVTEGQMLFDEYGYSPWPSVEKMTQSLLKLKKMIYSVYGEIPIFTYVPPSNIISREGKLAVKKAFPEIKIFAGLYTGIEEPGILYQEFGPDPDIPGMYAFPRISSGYHNSQSERWAMANGIASWGMVNHFIHPDDILDPIRSKGLTWKDLSSELDELLAEMNRSAPYLRPMTNYEAFINFKKNEAAEVKWTATTNNIKIQYRNAVLPMFHYLRLTGSRIVTMTGGRYELLESQDRYRIYFIQGQEPELNIQIKPNK